MTKREQRETAVCAGGRSNLKLDPRPLCAPESQVEFNGIMKQAFGMGKSLVAGVFSEPGNNVEPLITDRMTTGNPDPPSQVGLGVACPALAGHVRLPACTR